jgi:hypothetical protein
LACVADLVEEQRSAVGLLEPADALLVRARERPLFVAEELGLEQVLLQRRTVHFHEVARRPERVVMDRPRDELLARPRFAPNEHRGIALRNLLDDVENVSQARARTDDAIEVVDVLLGAAEIFEVVLHPADLERFLDLDLHLLDLEGLLHVVERPDLHRLHGGIDRSECRHEDHGGRGMQGACRAQHVHAVAPAHLEVTQHDVEVAVVEALDRGVAVRGLFDFMFGLGETPGEPASERVVIVGDENPSHMTFR